MEQISRLKAQLLSGPEGEYRSLLVDRLRKRGVTAVEEGETDFFYGAVRSGEELIGFSNQTWMFQRRDAFETIQSYLYHSEADAGPMLLCGLPGSGKTTLLRQAIFQIPSHLLYKASVIHFHEKMNGERAAHDLTKLIAQGQRYFFLDSVDRGEDVGSVLACCSALCQAHEVKMVVTGSEVLRLYRETAPWQRVSITRLPYQEWRKLDNWGVEPYLRCGGAANHTLFAMPDSARAYLQRIFREDLKKWTPLQLRDFAGLTEESVWGLIREIVYSAAAGALQRELESGGAWKVQQGQASGRQEALGYLDFVGLTGRIETLSIHEGGDRAQDQYGEQIVLTQLGLQYSLTCEIVNTLVGEGTDYRARRQLRQRLLAAVRQRLMEDAIAQEQVGTAERSLKVTLPEGRTILARRLPEGWEVTLLYLTTSEKEASPPKKELLRALETRLGPIGKKNVLYLGRSNSKRGVEYINVNSYLDQLTTAKEP